LLIKFQLATKRSLRPNERLVRLTAYLASFFNAVISDLKSLNFNSKKKSVMGEISDGVVVVAVVLFYLFLLFYGFNAGSKFGSSVSNP
jgi:hypothetical protein